MVAEVTEHEGRLVRQVVLTSDEYAEFIRCRRCLRAKILGVYGLQMAKCYVRATEEGGVVYWMYLD